MELFAKVLQGPYAYLLILQVLIVAGLLLSLIYLIMLRMRQPLAAEAVAAVTAAPQVVARTPSMDSGPVQAVAASAADAQQLVAERDRARGLEQEAASMRDKVRYLESKLLEYEILQEEIGALSALKLENEKMRQELLTIKQSPASAPPPTPAPAVAETPAAPPPEAPPAGGSVLESILETPAPAPTTTIGIAVEDDEATRSALDGLLQQIDSITSEPGSKA